MLKCFINRAALKKMSCYIVILPFLLSHSLNRVLLCFLDFQQQEQDPTNLYISNLPLSMDEQELENMLKPFSQAISTRILRDAIGTSRGVGFARYYLVFKLVFKLCNKNKSKQRVAALQNYL